MSDGSSVLMIPKKLDCLAQCFPHGLLADFGLQALAFAFADAVLRCEAVSAKARFIARFADEQPQCDRVDDCGFPTPSADTASFTRGRVLVPNAGGLFGVGLVDVLQGRKGER